MLDQLFLTVVKSGQLRPGYIGIRVGTYHDEQNQYPIAYYSRVVTGQCYQITSTTLDEQGINIFYTDENGVEQRSNVSPRFFVYAYRQEIAEYILEHSGPTS